MKRTEIREQIFKLLFRMEFIGIPDMPGQLDIFFETPSVFLNGEESKDVEMSSKEEEYIRGKYEKIVEKLPEIDSLINETAKGWSVERLSKVDLTVLRLGIYELKFDDDIPTAVAIDEAVELAKRFGRDESGSFVNGILAKIAKQT